MSDPPELSHWYERLSPRAARLVKVAFSLIAGLGAALVLHYLLYRLGMPSQPFIYVAF